MTIHGHTKLVGLLGNPVSHTLSPYMMNPAFESENLIAEISKQPIEKITEIDTNNLPEGEEREAMKKMSLAGNK